jgi:hypothetical protein
MNMGVDEPWENSRAGVLGHLPGLVELNVPGLDADDLFLIEKYGRWSFAELFPVNTREHRMAITSTSYCAGRVRSTHI